MGYEPLVSQAKEQKERSPIVIPTAGRRYLLSCTVWVGLICSVLASAVLTSTASAQSSSIAKVPTLTSWPTARRLNPDGVDGSLRSLTTEPHSLHAQSESLGQPFKIRQVEVIDQGIAAYENGQYADAIALWQNTSKTLDPKTDPVLYALILNHLSLAHQQLGQLQAAEETITQSLQWLQQSEPTVTHLEVWAKALNTQGHLFWSQGQTEQALQTWQVSEQKYRQAQDPSGQLLAQLNQARARQALGLQTQAVQQLQTLYQQLRRSQNRELQATGLFYLGEALLRIGRLEMALQVLQQSIDSADSPSIKAAAILAKGNVERAFSERANSIGQNQQALAYATQAVQSYQQVWQTTDSPQDQLYAQLNLLHLLPQMGRTGEAKLLWPHIQEKLAALSPSRTAIDARLNAVQGVICLYQAEPSPNCGYHAPSGSSAPPPAAALMSLEPVLRDAISQSQMLQDSIAASYSLGLLGHLYELTGQTAKAQALTHQALAALEAAQAPDIAYRWHWQLGRLSVAQGEYEQAKIAYQSATQVLEAVRQDLRRTSPNAQFAFRDAVEPVYRQYVALLLRGGAQTTPNPQDLQRAIQEIDALQLSELENFLGCDLSAFTAEGADQLDPSAAIVYPILLPDRVAIIYSIPGQPLAYQETLIAQSELEATVAALRQALTRPSQTPEVLAAAQQLYQWLIAPLEADLQQSQIQTLVFAADGVLRNIPMGVLYDGQQYLIEKGYSIAVAPRLNLFRSQSSQQPLRMMSGGVSLPQVINGVSFPAIAQVQQELNLIPANIRVRQPLLDRDFTKANIADQLQRGNITGIHWKTHGVFSSDPEQTYLVAYQERINATDLDQLIQSFLSTSQTSLDLFILSACETALGDRRAVLGIAGVAVRAGARSTLSTLWQANDDATTKLTARFYEALAQTEITKAEALRQAQLSLIREEGYVAPHYWGTYLLLGNWR
jgi:CHAT domain-containing protein